MADLCPDCGAPGGDCQEKFESLLALEFQDPTVFGAAHHVTVICYNLQHPRAFSDEARAWMRSTLRAIVEEGLTAVELREHSKKQFGGRVRVLSKVAKVPPKVKWTMTVSDIRTDDPEIYVNDIMAWARSIINDLDG